MPLPPATPECATSSHAVETLIEPLGCPAEDDGGQEPARGGTDENGQRR